MTETATAPRSQQLLVTIFGLYAREDGDSLPVAAIVRMLGELGIDQAGVRSSVSRLKRRGVLESRREIGVSRYAISPPSLQIFTDGDARIYHPTRASLDDRWLMAIFSVPESERAKRHVLRGELTRLGFGAVASGVWIAPERVWQQTARSLHRLGLDQYVTFFAAEYLDRSALTARVSQWWDLSSLESLYAEFIEQHEGMLGKWEARLAPPAPVSLAPVPLAPVPPASVALGDERDRLAFVDYIPMFTRWRHLPYLDPGLPLEVLPPGWNGLLAEQLFARLRELVGPLAHDHAARLIGLR